MMTWLKEIVMAIRRKRSASQNLKGQYDKVKGSSCRREKTRCRWEKTAACNGKSVPVTQLAAKKAKTGISTLEAITMKEEETTQKVLDLKKTKAQGETKRELAKIHAKTQQYKLKAELVLKKLDMEAKKMEHEFQLCMAQLGPHQPGPSNFEISHKTGAPSSGWLDAGSTMPSTSFAPEIQDTPSFNFYAGLNYSHLGQSNN